MYNKITGECHIVQFYTLTKVIVILVALTILLLLFIFYLLDLDSCFNVF